MYFCRHISISSPLSMKTAYWIVTVILCLFTVVGAVPDILQVDGAVQLFTQLGYPSYLLLIVGWAKILGVIGILQRKWPFLREWAYAGLLIDFAGAFASHTFVGDPITLKIPSVVAFILAIASYVLLRKEYGNSARLAALSY